MKTSFLDGQLKISATVASGLEMILKRELISLGYDPSGANFGRISFDGSFFDVARANMFLRTASRVYINLTSFSATSFDELFDGILSFRWQDILPVDARIALTAKSIKSGLFALSAIQSISKKAIVDKLKSAYKVSVLPESGDTFTVDVCITEDNVLVSLDTSGQPLHKRGYRTLLGEAPMRENLAAALVLMSFYKPDRAFIDPFCGSGTIPIETAMIATNRAPGLNREFDYQSFAGGNELHAKVLDEAQQLVVRDAKLRISGFDIDKNAIKMSMFHAKNAGVDDLIHFQVADMRNLSSRYSHGVIVTNPPYGERLMKGEELYKLYRDFGKVFRTLDEWNLYLITSCFSFEKQFGKKADKTRKLYNGELECFLYQYFGAKPTVRKQQTENED